MITDKTIRMNDNMVTDKTIMMHNPMTTEKTIMLMNDDQDLSNKTILENTSSNHQKDSDINVLNNDESGKKIENSYHNESKHPHKVFYNKNKIL